jgi:hypothetical protein
MNQNPEESARNAFKSLPYEDRCRIVYFRNLERVDELLPQRARAVAAIREIGGQIKNARRLRTEYFK